MATEGKDLEGRLKIKQKKITTFKKDRTNSTARATATSG
jgi:hypothetical protein